MTMGTDNAGRPIYQGFHYPDSLNGLDITVVRNTLDHLEFLAEMSDDYHRTREEIARINRYRQEQGL